MFNEYSDGQAIDNQKDSLLETLKRLPNADPFEDKEIQQSSLQEYLNSLPWNDPEKLLAAISSTENIFLSSFCLREMFANLKSKLTMKTNENNQKNNSHPIMQSEEEVWEEIKIIWKKRQRDTAMLQTMYEASEITKRVAMLVSSLEGIIEWLQSNLHAEEYSEINSSYNWFIKQTKEMNVQRKGDFFTLVRPNFDVKTGNLWRSPATKPRAACTRLPALGSRKPSDMKHKDSVPPEISSGIFEDLLTKYRNMLESLKSLYPILDVVKWSDDLGSVSQSSNVLNALKKFRDTLSDDHKIIENSMDSLSKVSQNLEESVKYLHETELLTKRTTRPTEDMMESLQKLSNTGAKIMEIVSPTSNECFSLSNCEEFKAKSFTEISWRLSNTNFEISDVSLRELVDIIVVPGGVPTRKISQIKKTFLATLPYFTTPSEILDLLFIRYCVVPTTPETAIALQGLEPFECVREEFQVPIRFNTCKLFRSWIKKHFQRDFDSSLSNRLKHFLTDTVAVTGNLLIARQCLELIHTHESSSLDGTTSSFNQKFPRRETSFPSPENQHFLNKVFHSPLALLMKSDPLQLATQLTCYEFNELYSQIKETELLHQVWNKEHTRHKAKQVTRSIRHFNRISAWIVRSILSQDNIEDRAALLKRIIVLALHLLRLKNYNGLIETVSALNNCAIERMNVTWNYLGKDFNLILATLNLLCQNNMKVFRFLWDKSDSTAAIPYIGLFLTDLTFMENGNPTFRENGKINFKKFTKIQNTISSLLKAQAVPYNIEPDPTFQSFFANLPEVCNPDAIEDAWFARSREIEPPEEAQKFSKFPISFPKSKVPEIAKRILQLLEHEIVQTVAFSPHLKSRERTISTPENSITKEYSFSIMEIQDVVEQMKLEVTTSKKRYNMRMYKDTFLGTDASEWLMKHFSFSEVAQAEEYGNMLLEAGFLAPVTSGIKSFRNDEVIYRFVDRNTQSEGVNIRPGRRILQIVTLRTSPSP